MLTSRFTNIRLSPTRILVYALATILLHYYACAARGATQAANFKHEVGLGGQVITTTDTAQFLVVPAGAEHAFITVETAPACYGHDISGAAPTTTSSGKWLAGSMHIVSNDPLLLKRLRLISCAAGVASTVQVYYTRSRRVGDAQ